VTITINDRELQTQPSDCIPKALLWGIYHTGLSMVTLIFLLHDNFLQGIQTGRYVGSTTELFQKHGGIFIHFNKKTFIIT